MALNAEKFANLERDIDDTSKNINEAVVITPRYGDPFYSAPLVSKILMENGAYEPFATEAQLLASTPLLPKRAAKALDTRKIWIWEVRAPLTTPAWYDTGESELDIAKRYAENAAVAAPKGIKQFGYYTGTSTTTLISQDGPQAYAVQVNESGFIKKFRTQLAGGPSKVRVQVYRPSDKGATLIETRLYDVSYPQSEVSLIDNPIRVEKNDLVTLAWVSGIFIRGKIVSSGDPLGSLIVTQTLTIGQQVAISRSRNSLEFQIDVLTDSQLATVQNIDPMTRLAVGYGVAESISTFKQGVLNTPTTTGSFSFAYGNIDALTKFGKLSQIKYTTRSISKDVLFRLCILAPNADGTHKVATVKQVLAPSDANGVVTATSKHFGDIFVPKGGYALIAGTTEIDAPLAQVGIAGGFSYIAATDIQLNANVTVSKNSNNQPISVEFTYESSSLNLEDRVVALENISDSIQPPLYSTKLDSQAFAGTTVPTDWTAPNWTVSDGLISPAAGGWNVTALSTGYSSLANREYRFDFTVTDVNCVFGFCTAPIEANSGSAVAMIDGVNGKLRIYGWDGSNAGTLVAEVSIAPLVAGSRYTVRVEKTGYFSKVTLINKITGATAIVEYSGTSPYVQFHGRAGFIFISGGANAVKINNYVFVGLYPKKVKAIVIGDSNSERAATVLPNETWAFKYADLRRMNADVIVAGRSGDETPNFLKRKEFDLKKWQPEYVVWALGTNDTDQNTWRTNMAQNIADTLALGAEPILVTQVPRGSASNVHFLMDEDYRNGYFGNYRYVEFAKAVSLNNDGFTWNPAYNSGDNLHVNPAGQERFLQQLMIDVPELFR
ncbi:SGNH/GDSL hydrolase family protein [Acinetobacter baumannii]|nr:SGNH/GDSL hydrolase family protein [Acinetobacter baumannii]